MPTSRPAETSRSSARSPACFTQESAHPNRELVGLDGTTVRLSDLWRRRGLVLEFGSYT